MSSTRKWTQALALGLGLWAASVQAEPASVKVAVMVSLSGASASQGISIRDAIRLAVAEQNWKGGFNGRKIELVERDDEDKPERAEALARELIRKEKVEFALGFNSSAVALRVLQQFQDAKIPVLIGSASDTALTRLFEAPLHRENYIFRNAASDQVQAQLIVRELLERHRFSRVAILAEASSYGKSGGETIKRQLALRLCAPPFNGEADAQNGWVKGGGGKLMHAPLQAEFAPGQTDMSGLIAQAKRAGVDALVVWAQAPEAAAIAKARARANWSVPLIGAETLGTSAFIKAAGAAGQGVHLPASFVAEPINSRRQEFLIAFRRQSGNEEIQAPVAAAQAYDSVLLLSAAVRQAGSTQGSAVRAALENLKGSVFGVVSTYERPFRANDHEAIAVEMLATGEVNGKRVSHAYKEEIQAIILGRKPKATGG
ncbi:ABC transporter substrate-binding protein [Niveibacterium terrae]|uniref:ABC transporter substrate-binding protein n=1 Tax=Niveibacterium terrae TaxID=3373598 RepID=UPI003A8C9EBE